MKTLIAILILLAFLQTTLLPINIVVIILLLRAYIKPDSTNLYLAFFFGILVAFLSHQNLGFLSALYLSQVFVTHLLSKSPLSKNIFSVVPIIVVFSLILEFLTSVPFGQSPNFFPRVIIEGFFSLPIYLGLRLWEERFVVRSHIKLKMR